MFLERVETGFAQDLARGEIVRGTERKKGGREFDIGRHHRFEHFHCFGDDLRPDSVTGDERECDGAGHGMTPGYKRDGERPSGAAAKPLPSSQRTGRRLPCNLPPFQGADDYHKVRRLIVCVNY